MDFTREPVIETIITPKDGSKLVVRSSKGAHPEEYFVDAVEVVSFGNAFFYRSLEKPKSFLLPIADYEIFEVREARMVVRHMEKEKGLKLPKGRGKEAAPKETETSEAKTEKKKERRRQSRRRRTSQPNSEEGSTEAVEAAPELPKPAKNTISAEEKKERENIARSLLPPPSSLISETIAKYRESSLFKDAFYEKGEEEHAPVEDEDAAHPIIPTETAQEEQSGEEWDFEKELTASKKQESSE